MKPRVAGLVATGILVLSCFVARSLRAQEGAATLSGTIRSAAGAAVANAKVSVKNAATGASSETQTDSAGHYTFSNLAAGDYEITVNAEGFSAATSKVSLGAGATQTADLTLTAAGATALPNAPAPTSTAAPGSAAPQNAAAPTLADLGITPQQTTGTLQDQERLNKRSHMLMLHQRFGLIAAAPMIATVFTGIGAGGRSTSTSDRWLHMALGSATGDLYFMSAYYAIRAPKIPGTKPHGHIRLHRALAWIHGPGMIATPILGAIAFDQKSKGEHVHGIAQAHGPVAIVTAAAYGAAILSVSLKF